MRYAYCLEKSLLQMILQTYLNYCTHLKATNEKTTTILLLYMLVLLTRLIFNPHTACSDIGGTITLVEILSAAFLPKSRS
jgi:hypothetical protein